MSDYEVCCENDRLFQAALKTKQVVLGIYCAGIVIGLIVFVAAKMAYNTATYLAVGGMLLSWGVVGFIANFFDKQPNGRGPVAWLIRTIGKTGTNIANARGILMKLSVLVGSLLGMVFGLILCGIGSPFVIIAYLIGIGKVKKQIADNNALLSRHKGSDSQ